MLIKYYSARKTVICSQKLREMVSGKCSSIVDDVKNSLTVLLGRNLVFMDTAIFYWHFIMSNFVFKYILGNYNG